MKTIRFEIVKIIKSTGLARVPEHVIDQGEYAIRAYLLNEGHIGQSLNTDADTSLKIKYYVE